MYADWEIWDHWLIDVVCLYQKRWLIWVQLSALLVCEWQHKHTHWLRYRESLHTLGLLQSDYQLLLLQFSYSSCLICQSQSFPWLLLALEILTHKTLHQSPYFSLSLQEPGSLFIVRALLHAYILEKSCRLFLKLHFDSGHRFQAHYSLKNPGDLGHRHQWPSPW